MMITYEIHIAPENPRENSKYLSRTPIWEQAQTAVDELRKAGKNPFIIRHNEDGSYTYM
jgi:hypothetical protein